MMVHVKATRDPPYEEKLNAPSAGVINTGCDSGLCAVNLPKIGSIVDRM